MSEMCRVPREANGRWSDTCLDALRHAVASEDGPLVWLRHHVEGVSDWRLLAWIVAYLVGETLAPSPVGRRVVFSPVTPEGAPPAIALAFQLLGATMNHDAAMARDVLEVATSGDRLPEVGAALLLMLRSAELGEAVLVEEEL